MWNTEDILILLRRSFEFHNTKELRSLSIRHENPSRLKHLIWIGLRPRFSCKGKSSTDSNLVRID